MGVECKHCGQYVRAKTKLGEHRGKEWRAWKERGRRDGEGEDGWMPVGAPEAGNIPERWHVYTDGSGPATIQTWRGHTPSEGAGWGARVSKMEQAGSMREEGSEVPAYRLSEPDITEKASHLLFGGGRGGDKQHW